jgi:hypothetical protein
VDNPTAVPQTSTPITFHVEERVGDADTAHVLLTAQRSALGVERVDTVLSGAAVTTPFGNFYMFGETGGDTPEPVEEVIGDADPDKIEIETPKSVLGAMAVVDGNVAAFRVDRTTGGPVFVVPLSA